MKSRVSSLAFNFQNWRPMMETIPTGVILAGLLAVAGCSQSVEQPATTGHDGNMGPGHMSGDQEHVPGHMSGRGER